MKNSSLFYEQKKNLVEQVVDPLVALFSYSELIFSAIATCGQKETQEIERQLFSSPVDSACDVQPVIS